MITRIPLSKSNIKIDLKTEFSSIDSKYVEEFENVLEDYYLGEKKPIALNSGTSAIHLALKLIGVEKGDEVLCQSFTYIATVNPVIYQDAKPVFIDSELDTWNMSPQYLEEAIVERISKGKKPKAIIFVHSYGMPAKVNEILSIAKNYGITLIEDSAEALGSTYIDQKCGTFGDLGILSFNDNKIITTSGGGALICKTDKAKQRALFLATQARDDTTYYQHSEIGYNYRMSNVLAGIGRSQMELIDNHVLLRRKMNSFYQKLFKSVNGVTVFTEPSAEYFSNHWLSCILIDSSITGFTKEDLRLQLEKDNIESRPLWKPMHLQPVFKGYDYYGSNIAETFFDSGLCLPSGSNLTDDDREKIAESIRKLL